MSAEFKPDVSSLQIVEVNVSALQKIGESSSRISSHLAEQVLVTSNINGLSQKLGVLQQPSNPNRINVFCVAKVWCESPYFRYTFATSCFGY